MPSCNELTTGENFGGWYSRLSVIQLTPTNSNLQGTKENSSTYWMFELIETSVKASFGKNEMLVWVKPIPEANLQSEWLNKLR